MFSHVKSKIKVSKDEMLDDIHMYEFQNILERESRLAFSMQSTLLLQTPELIKSIHVGKKHIQILFSGDSKRGHWICTYYDGQVLYIYDSLNEGCLNEDQLLYLSKLYPFKPQVVIAAVQQQLFGSNDCGVFAIAFASSIFLNELPNDLEYVLVDENLASSIDESRMSVMRRNLNLMFEKRCLIPFQVKKTTVNRPYIVQNDWGCLTDQSNKFHNNTVNDCYKGFLDKNSELTQQNVNSKLYSSVVKNKKEMKEEENSSLAKNNRITVSKDSECHIQHEKITLNCKNRKEEQKLLIENVNKNSCKSSSCVNNDLGELKLKTQYARQKRYREKKIKEKLLFEINNSSCIKKRDFQCNIVSNSVKISSVSNYLEELKLKKKLEPSDKKSKVEQKLFIDNTDNNSCKLQGVLSSTDIQFANDIADSEYQIQKKGIKLNREKRKVKQDLLIENVDSNSYESSTCVELSSVNNDLGDLKLKTQYARQKKYRDKRKMKEKLIFENNDSSNIKKVDSPNCNLQYNLVSNCVKISSVNNDLGELKVNKKLKLSDKKRKVEQELFIENVGNNSSELQGVLSSSDIPFSNDTADSECQIQKKRIKLNCEKRKAEQDLLIENVDNNSCESSSCVEVLSAYNDLGNLKLKTQCARQERYREKKKRKNELCFQNFENYLGRMNYVCQYCDAKHFSDEQIQGMKNSYNDCCGHGGVKLQSKEYPHELRVLLDGSHPKSSHFMQCVRCYNSSFAFASFNANIIDFKNRRPGPYCFKIQGQIYYQMNTALYPENGVDPCFGQLFIYDADDAVQFRLNYNENLDTEILYSIENVMRTHNAFTKSLKMMKEVIEIESELARENDKEVPELKLLFTLKKGMDRRRFNFQRVNEVAAIFNTNSEGEVPESYVTIHNKQTQELQLVSSLDPNVEPWVYPIFYPYGIECFNINMIRIDSQKRRKKVKVSRGAFIKYKIAIRDKEFNPFLHGGRLFQQYLVDNGVKYEKDKLSYCENNQRQLRSESYKGLIDYMQNISNEHEIRIGKMVILPSTFIGSPRNMMQQYQDAMAIVRKHGKPDLFITMTCNLQWKEIQENLFENQTASDRPDIIARVFSLKVNHLIEVIVRQKLFGEVKSFVYVVEFQKRGLPHIHMLVILKEKSKILSPESVDCFLSAEIPDEKTNPILHRIIMQNNIHGPCGDWCIVDGKCSKKFPKAFQNETTIENDSYVLYRRRDVGKTYERPNGYVVDNRYVVPYSPMLSQMFNCHINVEIVSSINSVKYLFKYIYKGHDAASIIITNVDGQNSLNHNEIRHYEENRYLGPVEAVWRILCKPLGKKSHSVNRLPIHLPNEQNVIIREGQDNNQISFNLEKNTKLLDYFNLNKRDRNAHQYYYSEIPEHYTWISDTLQWRPRKRFDNIIGRIFSVCPSQIELFHLRLLLLTRKGATSYEDLRTINEVVYETFTSACLALGLIEDDHEWIRTIEEAAVWMMPQLLRRLFVRILIHCHPVEPNDLWERFKGIMSEDYRAIGNIEAENRAYRDIKTLLYQEGYRLTDFQGLLDIEDEQNSLIENNIINIEEHIILGNEKYTQLNAKQKTVVDYVLKSIDDSVTNNCRCIYVDGPGGSGKTFLYNTLWHLLKSKGKNVCNMAFTGIAATLLRNGKTVHKILGLPVPLYSDSSSSVKVQSKEGIFLKETDVFIWDEATMAPKYALEIMDKLLRDIMKSNKPFGGKVLVLGGDFRQILPIKERGTRSEIVNLSIKNSNVWRYFTKFTLSENMRALPEETEFVDFLLKVGNGELNDEDDNIELPEKIIQKGNMDIVDDVYGDLIREKRFQEIANCAILAPRNVDVDDITKRVVQLLDSDKEKVYKSVYSTENCDNCGFSDTILPEYLNSLSPTALPPHELHLRIHSVVMLIRNLSINEGLCNGTRLLILDLLSNVIKCQILTGDKRGNIVFLHRITLYCENIYPFTFKRRQFPIKLAFAMTINKSQGQTFNRISIDLRRDVFNHGQMYVALSRVRSFNSIKVYLGDHRSNKLIKNYVYTEVLEEVDDIGNT